MRLQELCLKLVIPDRQMTVKLLKIVLTPKQRCWCVVQFAKANSAMTLQNTVRRNFHVNPTSNTIHFEVIQRFHLLWKWSEKGKFNVGLGASCWLLQKSFFGTVKINSISRDNQKLDFTKSKVNKMIKKLQQQVKATPLEFWINLQELMENAVNLLLKIIYRDEATSRLGGKVNRHNFNICGMKINFLSSRLKETL